MTRILLSSNTTSTLAPYIKDLVTKVVGYPEGSAIAAEAIQRLAELPRLRALYDCRTWGTVLPPRRPTEDFTPAQIESLLAPLIIDVGVAALFGSDGPHFACGDWRDKHDSDQYRENKIYEWAEEQNLRARLHEAATEAAVSGDVFLELVVNEKGTPEIIFRPADQVFPFYDTPGGKLKGATICYEIAPKTLFSRTYFLPPDTTQTHLVDSYWRVDGGKISLQDASGTIETPFDFVPVYHVRNRGSLQHFYGISDLRSIFDLVLEYNRAVSDLADARRLNAFPVKWVQGFGVDPSTLVVAPDAIWELPEGGSAGTLQVGAEFFRAMLEQLKTLQELILLGGEIPAVALGDTATLRDTSGVALEILYSLLIRKVERKRRYWTAALTSLLRDYLHLLEVLQLDDFQGNYQVEIVWPPIAPRSLERAVDTAAKAVAAKIWSPSRAIDYTGVQDATRELRQIKQEQLQLFDPYPGGGED